MFIQIIVTKLRNIYIYVEVKHVDKFHLIAINNTSAVVSMLSVEHTNHANITLLMCSLKKACSEQDRIVSRNHSLSVHIKI